MKKTTKANFSKTMDSSDDVVNISDVIDVIQRDQIGNSQGNDDMQLDVVEESVRSPALLLENQAAMKMRLMPWEGDTPKPYIKILEQPSTGIRFRYEIEGRSAGSIPGRRSTPDQKTYPTITIVGYTGKMSVVVSCVTAEDNPAIKPRPHPHNLVGKQNCEHGFCKVKLKGDNMTVPFQNLGIQCVKRKDVEKSLSIRKTFGVDPFNTGFAHSKTRGNFALNKVRLCFQGFILKKLEDGTTGCIPLDPVVSEPILERKATSGLNIFKMSHYSASVAGGLEMIILCDKVSKEDIQIRFFEERPDSVWEAYADFQPTQVHYQHAIYFRTPKYNNQEITEPVTVQVQLTLRNKPERGPPRDFEMLPLANVGLKRKSPQARVSEFLTVKPEKRSKTVSPSLKKCIKTEPRLSPFGMSGGSVSPNPYFCALSTSPQPGPSYQQYRSGSPMIQEIIYNIPLDQYQPSLQNPYEFPQPLKVHNEFQSPSRIQMDAIFLENPPLLPYQQATATGIQFQSVGPGVYQSPAGLNLLTEENSFLNLDSQRLLAPGTDFGTSELINAVLDHKLSQELKEGLEISALSPEPDREESSGTTDSFTELARDIQTLNEMCKPRFN
ncbi:embryonic polarity protein dorsal-like isoform X2 [Belonocnema kinseyi]|uniref:embryonic polarity protein dorsal-like isoform X2 n=1 Tax=Belonocnema kinseyi TaxID=2817044 RepID=UPI00143E04C8|nr:embryonic polarity protein dorsal-like isoform X2 [Belonocnema kinseyi]